MELIFAGVSIARRLEASDAANAAGAASESIRIAGGVAAFGGAASPLTRAVGIGMDGPVTDAEFEQIEAYYHGRGAAVSLDVCPLAHPSLLERASKCGYQVVEFNNILVRQFGDSPAADDRVRQASAGEQEVWATTMSRGFFDRDQPSREEIEIGRALFRMSGAACWLGFIEGAPAAAAAAAVRDGVLTMFADSTLWLYRGRGLQRAIINARLAWGAAQGCELATAATAPGSISQRNYQRAGFQVAYTKLNMQREWS